MALSEDDLKDLQGNLPEIKPEDTFVYQRSHNVMLLNLLAQSYNPKKLEIGLVKYLQELKARRRMYIKRNENISLNLAIKNMKDLIRILFGKYENVPLYMSDDLTIYVSWRLKIGR